MDEVSKCWIKGWAQETEQADSPVSLLVTAGDHLVARLTANVYRRDLELAGIGNGRFGFELSLLDKDNLGPLSALEPCIVRITRELDGVDLDNSPFYFKPPTSLSEGARDRLASALLAEADSDELIDRIAFVATILTKLIDNVECRQGGRLEREELRILRHRWSWGLEAPNVEKCEPRKRALVIGPALNETARDSHCRAMLAVMLTLSRLDFSVTFVDTQATGNRRPDLVSAGIEVCGQPHSGSVEEVLRRRGDGLQVVVFQGERVASCYLPIAKFYCPEAYLIYSVGHLSSIRMKRQAQIHGMPLLLSDSIKVEKAEMVIAGAVDLVTVQTKRDADHFKRSPNVQILRPIASAKPTTRRFADRSGVAFIGSQLQASNRDAVRWLTTEIMPLVWVDAPHVILYVVGHSALTNLGLTRDPRVKELGDVASLTPILGVVRLTVCPLAFGSGLKGAVVESLAAGVPCICTPVAAEGLDFEGLLLDLLGRDAPEIAGLLVSAHQDISRLEVLSELGQALVQRQLSEEDQDAQFATALSRMASGGSQSLLNVKR